MQAPVGTLPMGNNWRLLAAQGRGSRDFSLWMSLSAYMLDAIVISGELAAC